MRRTVFSTLTCLIIAGAANSASALDSPAVSIGTSSLVRPLPLIATCAGRSCNQLFASPRCLELPQVRVKLREVVRLRIVGRWRRADVYVAGRHRAVVRAPDKLRLRIRTPGVLLVVVDSVGALRTYAGCVTL
jgi:hypothetical protein